ncbi:molybdopterin-dependent oxidoreductase [Chloroflexus sp.]
MSLELMSFSPSTMLPAKDARLRFVSDVPLILYPPLAILNEELTPVERLFVRNRQPHIPHLADSWELTIDGLVRYPLTITLSDLQRTPVGSLIAALIGQSREHADYANIANAEWIGTPLALLLEAAGVKAQASFAVCRSAGEQPLVCYVTLSKLWQDGMLAYAVNGQPLPAVHGGPVRLVVPGWYGFYWIKWLTHITLISADKAPPEAHCSGELAIDCRLFTDDHSSLYGMAWSGGHGVARVMLSVDGGPWVDAELDDDLGPRAWRRFWYRCLPVGSRRLAVQISDNRGRSTIRRWDLLNDVALRAKFLP